MIPDLYLHHYCPGPFSEETLYHLTLPDLHALCLTVYGIYGPTCRWLELFQHGSMGSMEPPAGTARRSVRRSGGVPAAFRRCRNGSGASCWNAAGTPGCSSGRSGSVPAPFRTSRGHRRSRWMSRCATRIRSPLQLPWLDPHSLTRWRIVLCHPGPDHRTIWSPL